MRYARITTLILGALLCAFGTVWAYAEVRFVAASPHLHSSQSGNIRDIAHVEIYGEIRPEDVDTLPSMLEKAMEESRMATGFVFLNSFGGNVMSAVAMGRFLRSSVARTVVATGDECNSACIFILAGGSVRMVQPGALIGLHRPKFEENQFANLSGSDAQELYKSLVARIRTYLAEMGIASKLADDMLSVPSQNMRLLGRDYAVAVGLNGEDAGHGEWERARLKKSFGEEGLENLERLKECLAANSRSDASVCDALWPTSK